MDRITSDLMEAAQQILTHCKVKGSPVDTWAFEEGSEAYLALSEADASFCFPFSGRCYLPFTLCSSL